MQSKNKKSQTAAERAHVARVKSMRCGVCDVSGPSDAHELQQGFWWTVIPLCKDCHQGPHNGIHGQKRMWNVFKVTELSVLNDTVRQLVST